MWLEHQPHTSNYERRMPHGKRRKETYRQQQKGLP